MASGLKRGIIGVLFLGGLGWSPRRLGCTAQPQAMPITVLDSRNAAASPTKHRHQPCQGNPCSPHRWASGATAVFEEPASIGPPSAIVRCPNRFLVRPGSAVHGSCLGPGKPCPMG